MMTSRATCLRAVAVLCCVLSIGGSVAAEEHAGTTFDIQTVCTPSGWMGDGEYGRKYIDFSGSDTTLPHSSPSCVKVTCNFGPNRWAGMYWQNQPDNWGDKPGISLSGRKLSKLTFWARGEAGNEIVEFKAGGIDNPKKQYRDSFVASLGRQSLTKEWKRYEIDLSTVNLSSVIGAFCWVVGEDYSPGKRVTFYLDDIIIQ